jgi:hypothetical protein
LRLYGDYKGVITSVHQIDGVAVVDTFKVHDIVTCNDFAMTPVMVNRPGNQQDSAKSTYGIWIRLSYINHSCLPNYQRTFHGNLVLAHATRPIAEGEEITHSYSNGGYRDYGERTKQIQSN